MTLPCHPLFVLIYLSCTACCSSYDLLATAGFLTFSSFFSFDFHSTLMFPSSRAEASHVRLTRLCVLVYHSSITSLGSFSVKQSDEWLSICFPIIPSLQPSRYHLQFPILVRLNSAVLSFEQRFEETVSFGLKRSREGNFRSVDMQDITPCDSLSRLYISDVAVCTKLLWDALSQGIASSFQF